MTHHARILSAYPGLLPGFFTLADEAWGAPRHHPWRLAWSDPSEAPPSRDARHAALFQRYLEECAAACSILFNFCDAVQCGETIVVTAALSAEQFDRLAALGAAIEDLENDDPAEDDDAPEEDDAGEADHRDEFAD